MKALVTLILCGITSVAVAESKGLPQEVKSYIAERNICDHFRGEPIEGNSPEQIERREFVADSLDIYCSGTDKRLAALKRRYKNNRAAMDKLSQYEERIEGAESN
ncbi:hypothetical protein [Cupriavidus necator]|uniref:hypothetical protein n=1 Tax=Cupriavidus necator TaxID=106590 RepID=UPI0039C06CAF